MALPTATVYLFYSYFIINWFMIMFVIVKCIINNFNVSYIDDGTKYNELFENFLLGQVKSDLIGSFPDRKTWRVEALDRTFVVKRISAISGPAKRHFWDIFVGCHFSRLLRETWMTIERGCDFIPRVYLAAEKYSGWRRCVDSYLYQAQKIFLIFAVTKKEAFTVFDTMYFTICKDNQKRFLY
jgi:hypothetical protein